MTTPLLSLEKKERCGRPPKKENEEVD